MTAGRQKFVPTGIIVDRANAEKVDSAMREMGGAWASTFGIWRRLDAQFLIMLAQSRERLIQRAPLIFIVQSPEQLADAMQAACLQLDDVPCRWVLFMEENTPGIQTVRELLLKDAAVGGTS
jgi:hypothetical protein